MDGDGGSYRLLLAELSVFARTLFGRGNRGMAATYLILGEPKL